MEQYDLIVIGSGAGLNVASPFVSLGKRVALIDDQRLGGTCLTRGCIPSKVMIHPADVIRELQESKNVGVHGKITRVDFDLIMKRTRAIVDDGVRDIQAGVDATPNFDFYNTVGRFVDDYTLEAGGTTMTAPKIIIASGARPTIPPIEGIEKVGYLTNRNVWQMEKPPKKLLIVGGGFVAVEFAHFFSAIGVKVEILGRNPRLIKTYDPDVSEVLKKKLSQWMHVHTGMEVERAEVRDGKKILVARDTATGKKIVFKGDEIILASGRRSNSDLLHPEKTGVNTDSRGWIVVNEHLETSKPNIWAFGDAIGKYQFRHTANYESEVVMKNAMSDVGPVESVDYHAVPSAVFTYPQVAAVGLGEEEAKKKHQIMVGRSFYYDTAMGYAINDRDYFFKVIVEAGTRKILGASCIGPQAATLVQQVTDMMYAGNGDYIPFAYTQTIHPALSEVVIRAFGAMQPVNVEGHHHQHAHQPTRSQRGHNRTHRHDHDTHGH